MKKMLIEVLKSFKTPSVIIVNMLTFWYIYKAFLAVLVPNSKDFVIYILIAAILHVATVKLEHWIDGFSVNK